MRYVKHDIIFCMNKFLILIVVVLAGVGALLYTRNHERSTTSEDTVSTTAAHRNSNACTLFSKTDIERIWGVSFKDPVQGVTLNNPGHTDTFCKFEQNTSDISEAFSLEVSVSTYETDDAAKQAFDADLDSINMFSRCKDTAVSQTQVGDGTYFNVAACGELIVKTSSYIAIRKSNEIIDISSTRLNGVDQEQNRMRLIQLGQTKL
jgi:hypothetical protein